MTFVKKILHWLIGKTANQDVSEQPDFIEIPKSDGRDLVRQLALDTVSLSQIPHLRTLVGASISSPIENRVLAWRKSVAEALLELQQRRPSDIDFDSLVKSEEFGTTWLRATNVVITNHRKEKHEMLRNAVLNSALPSAPEDDERTIFLNFVDEFSVVDVLILTTLLHPATYNLLGFSLDEGNWRSNAGAFELFDFMQKETPGNELKFDFFVQALSKFHARSLISNTHSESRELSNMSHVPEVTSFGRRFLKFIESPLDEPTT